MIPDSNAGTVAPSQLEGEFLHLRAEFDTVPSPEQFVALEVLAARIEVVMRPARKEGACIDSITGQPVDPQLARQLLTLADPRGWMMDAAQAHQADIVASIAPHTSWRALDMVQRRALAYWRLLHPELTYGTVSLLGPASARARLELNAALRERRVAPAQPIITQPAGAPQTVPVAPVSVPERVEQLMQSETMEPETLREPTELVVVPLPVATAPGHDEPEAAAPAETAERSTEETVAPESQPEPAAANEGDAAPAAPEVETTAESDPGDEALAMALPLPLSQMTSPEDAAVDTPRSDAAVPDDAEGKPAATPAAKLTLLSRLFGKHAVVGVPVHDKGAGADEHEDAPPVDEPVDEQFANRPVSGMAPDAAYAEADTIDEATLALLTADNMHPPKEAKGFIRFDPYGTDNSLAEAITAYFEKIELRIPGGSMHHLSDRLAAFNHLPPDKLTDLPVGQYIWFPSREQLQHWLDEVQA
jgi:hypothetical protein